MFGIGWTEFIIIALVLLIFVGPKNLPPLLRKVGSIIAEFKAASRDLRNQLDNEIGDLESPRQIVNDFGIDVLNRVNDPYLEASKADDELKKQEKSNANIEEETLDTETLDTETLDTETLDTETLNTEKAETDDQVKS